VIGRLAAELAAKNAAMTTSRAETKTSTREVVRFPCLTIL
jgi:hypothetical protein